ncbi:hypothetical protein [Albibacterium indicum]|uniref:hypothetical protein n=1 Tax=Albibacterium indicum TaxID=2292082 RepID=UPI000E4A143E|nr:hypothetical protein [Pedobacter indicus]
METSNHNYTDANGERNEKRNEQDRGKQPDRNDSNKKEHSKSDQEKKKKDDEQEIPDYSNLDIDESTGGSAMGDPEDGEPKE